MDGDLIIGLLMVIFWLVSSLVARFGRMVRQRQSGRPPRQPAGQQPQQQARQPASQQAARRAGESTDASQEPALQKMLRDLAEQMGLETEVEPAEPPRASEHRPTSSEHRRTQLETRATASEHQLRASEHQRTPSEYQRTASETRRTASEEVFALPEHQVTASEHQWGDVVGHGMPQSMPRRHRQRSKFLRRLHADLAGGRDSLARAVVLREILGPPVGLRSEQ